MIVLMIKSKKEKRAPSHEQIGLKQVIYNKLS